MSWAVDLNLLLLYGVLQSTQGSCGCYCWWLMVRKIQTPFYWSSTSGPASTQPFHRAWASATSSSGPTRLYFLIYLEIIQVKKKTNLFFSFITVDHLPPSYSETNRLRLFSLTPSWNSLWSQRSSSWNVSCPVPFQFVHCSLTINSLSVFMMHSSPVLANFYFIFLHHFFGNWWFVFHLAHFSYSDNVWNQTRTNLNHYLPESVAEWDEKYPWEKISTMMILQKKSLCPSVRTMFLVIYNIFKKKH